MNSGNCFPRPTTPLAPIPSVHPRTQLAPLRPPPLSNAPQLPVQNDSALRTISSHVSSVHVIEAAFPRCISSPGRVEWPDNLESKDRKKWVKDTAANMIKEKRAIEKSLTRGKLEDGVNGDIGKVGLWNTVLRVSRKETAERDRRGISIVTTHPIGFHKETWETVFFNLIELTEKAHSPIRIEELWSLECVNHGDAALINGVNIPKLPDRSDYARDLANFCIYHLPSGTVRSELQPSLHLPRLDQSVANRRMAQGHESEGRTLVGIGHSLGGDATALCALSYPNLFSSIILSETTLFPPKSNSFDRSLSFVAGTLGRRAVWPSREEAREAFLRTPLFQTFHPAVLESYITHALYEDKENRCVRLKCNPEWEASEFMEQLSMNEGWELLPSLDEKIALHWIMGGLDSASDIVGGVDVAQRTVWRRPKGCSNVRIPGAGHLVVQEKPVEFGEVVQFLHAKYGKPHQQQSKL